jgi:hypothetical protein
LGWYLPVHGEIIDLSVGWTQRLCQAMWSKKTSMKRTKNPKKLSGGG